MDIIDAAVKPDHISSLMKQLDKARMKFFSWNWLELPHNSPWIPQYQNR